jgi:hypothetical protein
MVDFADRTLPGQLCGFCYERPADSGEHIYDDWICRRLEAGGIASFTHSHATGGPRKTWHSNKLDRKINVVCEQCNNTWMSDITNAAKPTVEAIGFEPYADGDGIRPRVLEAKEIASLALWVLLKAMVMDLGGSDTELFYTKTQRLNFYHRRSLPRWLRMWISSMFVQAALYHSYTGTSANHVKHGVELNCANYGVGRFLVQVVHYRWKRADDRHNRKAPAWDFSLDEGLCIPIWPTDGSPIHWPPTGHLGNKGIEKFVNRLYPIGQDRFIFPAVSGTH